MSMAKRTGVKRAYPVAAATVIAPGLAYALVAGYLTALAPAATAAKVAGVATLPADNEHGAAGAVRAEVEVGEHKFKNGGDITVASVGVTAYMADAHSVVLDAGTAPTLKPVAGTIVQVDDDGVWVRIGV